MSILDQINKTIIDEYKSGNQEKRVLLQTVKAEILSKSKDLKKELSEDEEIAVISREKKIRLESIEQFKKGERADLVEKAQAEVDILSEFLPEQLDTSDIEVVVDKVVSQESDQSFGNIMRAAMAELKGKADGSAVAEIVKKKLG